MSEQCIFCRINSGEIPSATVYEDDEFRVIHDRFPANKGHLLIIPKEHVEDIYDLDPEVAGRLFKLATKLARAIRKTFNSDGLNIIQNNGEIAGQTVFHYHLHMIPRYENDDVQIMWEPDKEVTAETLQEYVTQIKNNI